MPPLVFSFPPPWWQCCISLPDEADKVLVGKEGGLLFDFERQGTGRREFRTVVEPFLVEGAEYSGQQLHSPRAPVVSTQWSSGGIGFVTEVVSVVPPDAPHGLPPPVERQGGEEATEGWDGPKVHRVKRNFFNSDERCGLEFRDAAWAEAGGEIVYVFRVPSGAKRSVVVGLGEGEHREPGKRILEISADGGAPLVLDPVDVFGAGRAGLCGLSGCDADGDGLLRVRVRAAAGSPDRSPFVSAIWLFEGMAPDEKEIFSGAACAAGFVDCGRPALPGRQFLMRLEFRNATLAPQVRTPALRIFTLERVRRTAHGVRVGSTTDIIAEGGGSGMEATDGGLVVRLSPVEIPAGGTAVVDVAFNRHGCAGQAVFDAEKSRTLAYWQSLGLPYGVIEVPDARIQALLDSSIRNIYQARDIERGLPAFHVGPTCYRQLWIVDGAFLLEAVTMLGRGVEARDGISYMLGFQEADGGFQLKARYWKETGIVLWALARHAVLTGDKDWLSSLWTQIQRAVGFLISLRTCERAGDPANPEFRLAPYGDIDGGISNMEEGERLPEFSNAYWLMTGLKAAAGAARWIGRDEEARAWRAEFEEYLQVFHTSASRNMREDAAGNPYLPVRMGAEDSPQKGQWAFCHAVHPGSLFEPGSEFVAGMLAMLDEAKVEGLVRDTGWMPQGLWTYFASFLGHAHLWQGNAAAAISSLEAFADHAAPVLVWREEQKPSGEGAEEVGDMPHNWASAEFIRLTLHLIAFERGDELHLFKGIPGRWNRPGSSVRVSGAATAFGPLTAALEFRKESVFIEVSALSRPGSRIVIHRDSWAPGAAPLEFPPDRAIHLEEALAKP